MRPIDGEFPALPAAPHPSRPLPCPTVSGGAHPEPHGEAPSRAPEPCTFPSQPAVPDLHRQTRLI